MITAAAALLIGAVADRAAAQTPFVPYFGKNQIHYDTFDWHIYATDHFEIYYYPEIETHLARVAGYAESAYQQVSADLKHDLSFKIPLVLFKTHSEFEQQNIAGPEASSEGVGAFAEPFRQRMVMPIDDPPDLLYGLIVHELTHQFEFDIIPQGLMRRSAPLWVNEGLSDYERGQWNPIDLMSVRDAAVADIVPKMSELEGYAGTNPRLIYNLGHAVFEFIETKFGKEGIRQFLFALRKSVIGGGEDAYEEALKMSRDEFDQAFERYLKDRFKPFRDKERPADYGRDLAPSKERTGFAEALSIAPSPSGDLIAAVTVNRNDRELDIVLLSSKDGSIVRNLTRGFDKDMGFDHIVQMGQRFEMPWMAWSPKGDRLAYFVRTEKERALILQNVLTRKIEAKIPMKSVDEPESPSFSPDGRTVAFAALRGAVGDIYTIDLDTKAVVNLTEDAFADAGPSYSPDGKSLIYNARVSGNQKLFRFDFDTRKKTQLTFGTQDETAAQFIDDHTIVFSSTATDPSVPLEPEIVRNGKIYNIWTLDLKTGELRQYTDALGGDWSTIVLNEGQSHRIAFISYYKGEYGIHSLDRKEPLHTAASADFGAPGPIIDFQAPLTHTLLAGNTQRKGTFGKLFLEGRPPVNVGVTSGGDVFGGTTISFADVTGDHRIDLAIASVSQYRTLAASYVNVSRRLQWAVQGYSQTQFFFGQTSGTFFDPAFSSFIDRDLATATRTVRGGSVFGIYPLDRYRRVELSAGLAHYSEQFRDPALDDFSTGFQQQQFGRTLLRNGTFVPLSAAFVQETTVFRDFGPLAGNTMRLAYEGAPAIGGSLSRQTVDADLRYYQRLGATGVLALRARGFRSWGDSPDFLFFGGNSELRGYQYLEFLGQNAFFGNAELRFPLIDAMATPIGILGGIRGVFFFNMGGAWFDDPASGWWTAAPPTASGSRPSRSASRFTSTGPGARSSTANGKTSCLPAKVEAAPSAKPGSTCGLATTSEARGSLRCVLNSRSRVSLAHVLRQSTRPVPTARTAGYSRERSARTWRWR
ncbi:MAG: PD40 domain-containing protein [Acidobacteria bacterium]|nr:PD40 domain-containing protein [Acidobacteriota bacterium]